MSMALRAPKARVVKFRPRYREAGLYCRLPRGASAVIVILPVVRIERYPGDEPQAKRK